jgi:uncharacterized protein YbjT (DUF2867 family)
VTIAFVSGATGLTGREVVRVLSARGIQTLAHVRPDSARLGEWRQRFEQVGARTDTTPWQDSTLADRLTQLQPDLVFGLLGTTRARGNQSERATGQRDTYESVDYGLTAMLLRATVAGCPGARFVYLSALGVSGDASGGYYGARFRIEQELKASGVPFTIARPSFILGERDESRPGERIGSTVADAALGVAAAFGARRLRARYQSIQAPDLAEALVRLALDPAAQGRTVHAEDLR